MHLTLDEHKTYRTAVGLAYNKEMLRIHMKTSNVIDNTMILTDATRNIMYTAIKEDMPHININRTL